MAFVVESRFGAYTVLKCTAIAQCDEEDERARQDALYVKYEAESGEVVEDVVFGWAQPETEEDWERMAEDNSAWDTLQDYHMMVIEE